LGQPGNTQYDLMPSVLQHLLLHEEGSELWLTQHPSHPEQLIFLRQHLWKEIILSFILYCQKEELSYELISGWLLGSHKIRRMRVKTMP